jgi:hypothetical protein
MPNVLQQVKKVLIRKGFLVQTMPTSNPVIVAYQQGGWLRKPRQLVLEISSTDNNQTRIDITAIISNGNSRHAEEILELDFASVLKHTFKKVTATRNGN